MVRNPHHREDWLGLVTWLRETEPPGHTVIAVDPLHELPIEHYAARTGTDVQVEVLTSVEELSNWREEAGEGTVLLPAKLTSGPLHDWARAQGPMSSPLADFQTWRLRRD
jgi:hypothetical protein